MNERGLAKANFGFCRVNVDVDLLRGDLAFAAGLPHVFEECVPRLLIQLPHAAVLAVAHRLQFARQLQRLVTLVVAEIKGVRHGLWRRIKRAHVVRDTPLAIGLAAKPPPGATRSPGSSGRCREGGLEAKHAAVHLGEPLCVRHPVP